MPAPSSRRIERRQFISTVFGAGVAAAALAKEEAPKVSYKGENIQYGLVTYMWAADLDLPTLIETCDKSGIQGVELRVEHGHKVDPTLTPPQRVEVRKRFEDAQVKLIGMGTNFEFHDPSPEKLAKNLASAKEYIKLSHDIGGSGVKVKPNALPKGVEVEKTLAQIGKALAELGDYSIGFGQEIRLEVHGGVTDLGYIRTIMQAAGRDNVRVCWNCNDADLAGDGIEANFAKVKDYLGHTLHMREATDKKYPYDKLAKLLVEADFDGYTCLEGHKPPAVIDRVPALIEQRQLWQHLVMEARRATA